MVDNRFIALVLLAAVALAAPAAQGPRRPARADDPRLQWKGRDIQVGDVAPDFSLPRLDPFLKAAEQGEAAPARLEMVRLSALRGKRPVVLVFSSYT